MRSTVLCLLVVAGLWAGSGDARAEPKIPAAFGPHVNLKTEDFAGGKSFAAGDRLVGTYYFYWYDQATGEHMVDADGTDALTTHPASLDGFSYRSERWHRTQLEDMAAAGIDVVLPVFWGAPSEQAPEARLHWSYTGLAELIKARASLVAEGRTVPRIGMFYDTSTLQNNTWNEHIDLTTDFGRRWFHATVRDFFSLVPPRDWAMIDGKPIVLLYAAAFAKAHDTSCIEYVKTEFRKEFGGREPWIAAEVSWRVRADSTVAWGGALGLRQAGVASLGPGYDHSAVPGRQPLVVDRRDGRFYEEQWMKFLRRPTDFVVVETWNEFHEGTDVACSREHGRRFIDLTRKYADLFKQGWSPPTPTGPFADAREVSITLGDPNRSMGLVQIENEDGRTEAGQFSGRAGRAVRSGAHGGRYLYFAADDSFKWSNRMAATVEVEYFDSAPGRCWLEFDGHDPQAPFDGAYTRSPEAIILTGSGTWKTARLPLDGARLWNRQNGGSDFRLAVEAPAFAAAKASLIRR